MQSNPKDPVANQEAPALGGEIEPGRPAASESRAIRIRIEGFEGTLEALVDLVKRQQVAVLDIPVSKVTDQFLTSIRDAELSELESGAEFVMMAATLIHLKAKALLPKPPRIEEVAEDVVDDRTSQSVERLKFLRAAEILEQKREIEDAVWTAGAPSSDIPSDEEPKEMEVSLFDLVKTFGDVLQRLRSQPTVRIDNETVSVASRVRYLLDILVRAPGPIPIRGILLEQRSTRALVATFLALLEMVRAQAVILSQEELFGEIMIRKHERFKGAFRDGSLGTESGLDLEYSG